MLTSLFEFHLPPELIALRPAEPRDSARMLAINPGHPPQDDFIKNLPAFLAPGDALVVNDTPRHPGPAHRFPPARQRERAD